MKKIFTLSLMAIMFMATAFAQNQPQRINARSAANPFAKRHAAVSEKMQRIGLPQLKSQAQPLDAENQDMPMNLVVLEDFSKFTAGSESAPDKLRLDDANYSIDDKYFNTPGWGGLEVYQAGGMAYVAFSEAEYATGLIITPTLDLTGLVKISMRVRSVSPMGDYFNYNIIDEATFQAVDVNYAQIGPEWTTLEFTTTFGTSTSYMYFFTEMEEMFIDDIKIESAQMPSPVLREETNLSASGFTANWDAVESAELYDVCAYAEHKVGADGVCTIASLDFANMKSTATEDSPEVDQTNWEMGLDQVCPSNYPGWFVYMPVLLEGAVGVHGTYSAYEQFGYLSSPEMDLSANDGEVELSFRVKAKAGDRVAVAMLSFTDEGYQFVDSKAYETNGEWQEIKTTIGGGAEYSCVQIVYGGSNIMLLDDVVLTQQMPEGTVYNHQFLFTTIEETSLDIVVPEIYRGDKVSYKVRGVKNFWKDYDGELVLESSLESPYSEVRYVELPTAITAPVLGANHEAAGQAYDLQGRIVNEQQLPSGTLYIQGGKLRMK